LPGSSTGRIFIIVRAPNGDVREVPIGPTAIVIGRDESADIRVEDKKVSRRHAAFKLIDGEPWVEDLGSANGVKLNGKRIDKRARINPQDQIKVGGYRIALKDLTDETGSSVVDDDRSAERARGRAATPGGRPSQGRDVTPPRPPPEGARGTRGRRTISPPDDGRSPVFVALDDPVKGQRFVLRPGENIIGRLEECDVPVLDGSVSRQHARIVFARDRLSVSDLGASNGTFVNDTRVEMADLANGDVLRVGNIRFKLEVPPELSKQLSTPKTRSRPPGSPAMRPWATVGIAILLLAIAILSATIYWKWRARHDGRRIDDSIAARFVGDDSGVSEVIREITADAGGEEARAPDAAVAIVRAAGSPDARGLAPAAADAAVRDAAAAAVVEKPLEHPAAEKDAGVLDKELAAVRPIATATTPFGPRDGEGLPMNLPEVDATFDFEGFVDEKLAQAEQFEKDGDFRRVRTVLVDLLGRDPINAKGKEMYQRLELHETAEQAFVQAGRLEAKGNLSKALKLYYAVPENAPEAQKAKAKIEELKPKVIELELSRAEKELKSKQTYVKAHKRFKDVLDLDPESMRALKGVRAVERKMRAKGMRFIAYIPPNSKEPMVKESPQEIDDAIAKRYAGDEELMKIARAYAQGRLPSALKRAEGLEKRVEGSKKEDAKKLRAALKQISTAHERIRNEISNNPNEAWAKLRDLETAEASILPAEVKSIVRKELEESIAEAFAESGASQFERSNLEGAFVNWSAGYKLDPVNPKVVAGLRKLEDRAKQLADEAELAGQRGEKGLCDRWKTITRMTRPDSEVYKKAYERAKQICPA
jgi:pSer/pThr/pTyr-binding forkhead associated (FHA) protein/tetratricopeptide (TPR) repeat protein